MNLATYFKGIILLTIVALLYTHMQMRIFELAYKGKDKQNKIHELKDTYGRLTHDVLALKSAQHLGNTLMDKDSTMKFMGQDNVMTYTVPPYESPVPLTGARGQNSFWQLLSMVTTPEATAGE